MCAATGWQDTNGRHRDGLDSLDVTVTDDDGQPLAVWPCRHCADWHLHVLRWSDGCVVMREWHSATCPHLAAVKNEQ